jgi:lipoyl(octanoyl) transferase
LIVIGVFTPLISLKKSSMEVDSLYLKPHYCWLYNAGIMPYLPTWQWQQKLVRDRIQQPDLPDALILLQHPPVYTLGQGSSTEFLKFDPTVTTAEIHRTERGGEVTYHCPGQLVGYAILNLRYHQPDLHWYLRQLEEVLIQLLATYGLIGERLPGLTGVWVDGHKVAAIGIKVSRWITMHGFALNICPDLQGFEQIVPCGISDRPVGSLAQFIPDLQLESVQEKLPAFFAQAFGMQLIEKPLPKNFLELDISGLRDVNHNE